MQARHTMHNFKLPQYSCGNAVAVSDVQISGMTPTCQVVLGQIETLQAFDVGPAGR